MRNYSVVPLIAGQFQAALQPRRHAVERVTIMLDLHPIACTQVIRGAIHVLQDSEESYFNDWDMTRCIGLDPHTGTSLSFSSAPNLSWGKAPTNTV